jgi:hypothetical protein
MHILQLRCIYLFIFWFLMSAPSYGQLYTLQTKNLRLVYFKGNEYLVGHVARCFENALRFHSTLYTYTPWEPVTAFIQDFGDYGNGGAAGTPRNLISIGISPFQYTYETTPAVERMSWMMNHELTHIVTTDQSSPSSRFFRGVFGGKVSPISEAPLTMLYGYLTNPRQYSPSWFFEGQAVFMETWMNGGLGRALGAYDEMMFRTMVRDSSYFYDVVGLESEGTKVDFQVGANSYLYGTRFLTYLALIYGPKTVVAWNNQDENSKAGFASRFQQVYGVSLDDEWSKWIAWEHEWQKVNLDSLRVHPITSYRVVSHRTLGSVSRTFIDTRRKLLYAAVNYPGQVSHIAAINLSDGEKQQLQDVRGGALFYVTSIAYDSTSQKIYFSTDNNRFRDLNVFDLTTGKTQMLLKDARVGDFALNPKDKSLWGVRHENGISSLVRIPAPYREWNLVYAWPYGSDIFDLDISPDGTRLTAALAELDGTQKLIIMDTEKLLSGQFSFDVIFDFDISTPANFVFTPDGKHLLGSSYYSGVSNIVRYDFDTKDMTWVTNCETGLFRPLPVSSDSILCFMYTGRGFVPVMVANQNVDKVNRIRYLGNEVELRHPIVRSWQVPAPSPANVNIDSLVVYRGEYEGMRSISLVSAYPVVEGFKNFAAYGLRFRFADPIFSHNIDLTTSYTPNRLLPNDERLHMILSYRFWQWKLGATYNGSDFYDLFGPTKVSRKGYSLVVENKDYLLYDEPETMEYRVALGGYWGLERLPEFQNVETPYDNFYSLNARINYQYLMKSLGAVDDELGTVWQLVSHTNLVNGKVYPRIHTNIALGTLLPMDHSSLWFRGSAGYSFGDRSDPFSNFYFGGFGNNWVDHQEIKRYREDYSFPGVEINNIGGVLFGKGMIEWDLPPIRFRRFGVPSFYCNWARIGLFTSAIGTNFDGSSELRLAGNAGGQIDFRLVLFSSLESTLSFGYAVAAEKNQRLTKEFMVSLKIL